MEFQKGKKLAIFGASILVFNTMGGIILNYLIIGFEISLSEAISQLRTVISSLIDIAGLLLILIGVKHIVEEIRRREIYKNLLAAFIIYIISISISIVFTVLTTRSNNNLTLLAILGPYLSLLYFILYLISQGVLIPVSVVRLGTAFNSVILKISGTLLFISAILPLLSGYIFAPLYTLSSTWILQLLTIVIQLIITTTYILLLLGFISLKMPVSTEIKGTVQD
jgi:uncharacterized membrane protein